MSERKIVDYIIVKRYYNELFMEKCFDNNIVHVVKRLLSDGWQPLGAPFAYEGDVVQAMVKYED